MNKMFKKLPHLHPSHVLNMKKKKKTNKTTQTAKQEKISYT